jgi:hypothetical protein
MACASWVVNEMRGSLREAAILLTGADPGAMMPHIGLT